MKTTSHLSHLSRLCALSIGVMFSAGALAATPAGSNSQVTTQGANVAPQSATYSGSVATQQQLAQNSVQADRYQQAAMASAMQTFVAAVGRYAYEAFSMVPWNQTGTLSPIAYAPMDLYSAGSGFVGNPASSCAFPAATGTALPNGLGGPSNLSTLQVNFGSSTQQAQALQGALGGNQQFLPANFGSSWNGVFCAAVKFNSPSSEKIAVAAWYVPGSQAAGGAPTNAAAAPNTSAFSGAQSLNTGMLKAIPGASVYFGSNGSASWAAVK